MMLTSPNHRAESSEVSVLVSHIQSEKFRDIPTLLAAGRRLTGMLILGDLSACVPNRQDVRSGSIPSRCTLHLDQLSNNHASGMKLPGRLGTTMAVHSHLTMWVR
jgi:hypothetical protein